MNITGDFSINYAQKNYEALSKELNDRGQRIKLEQNLLNKFSELSKNLSAKNIDFAWEKKVLNLINDKRLEDPLSVAEAPENEDRLFGELLVKFDKCQKNAQMTNRVFQEKFKISQSDRKMDNSSLNVTVIPSQTIQHAIEKKDIEMVKKFITEHLEDKVEIKSVDLVKLITNLLKDTLLADVIEDKSIDLLKLIAEKAPDELNAAVRTSNEGFTPLELAVAAGNKEMMKVIAEIAPDEFKAAMITPDAATPRPHTPLERALIDGNKEMVKLIAEIAPDEFKAALITPTEQEETLLELVLEVTTDKIGMMKVIAETAPDEFKAALKTPNAEGLSLLAQAVQSGEIEMVKFILETAPDEFKAALKTPNSEEFPLLGRAIYSGEIEMVKLIAKIAPNEFVSTLKMEVEKGRNLLLFSVDCWIECEDKEKALNYRDMLKDFITTLKNHGSLETLNYVGHNGRSLLSSLEAFRPKGFEQVTALLKKHEEVKQFHEVRLARVALGHMWHLSGSTNLMTTKEKKTLATIDLEGHRQNQWYDLIQKNLENFDKSYPDLFSETQLMMLRAIFNQGANADYLAPVDQINLIKGGFPVLINAGYTTHAVAILFWGDLCVICNRGSGGNERPINVYHFQPNKLDEQIFSHIRDVSNSGTKDDYEKLLSTLNDQLKFSEEKIDKALERACNLPFQSVGNCSLVSPLTAVYAALLIERVRGCDAKGMINKEPQGWGKTITKQAEQALSLYQSLVSYQQISVLEENIEPLKQKDKLVFEPDHELIVNALRRAHSLPLDPICQEKLEKLTDTYLNSLGQWDRISVKANLMLFKALNKKKTQESLL